MSEPISLRNTVIVMLAALGAFALGNMLIYLVVIVPTLPPPAPAVVVQNVSPPVATSPAQLIPPAQDIPLTAESGSWSVTASGVHTQTATDPTDYFSPTGVIGQHYTASVEILLPTAESVTDAGGGLVFHTLSRDSVAGGQLVRLHRNGAELLWGSYDANGNFVFGGTTPVNAVPGQPHTLTIVVRAGNFDVLVDGQMVTATLPLSTNEDEGWISLMSYRGPVTFSNFRLTVGS